MIDRVRQALRFSILAPSVLLWAAAKPPAQQSSTAHRLQVTRPSPTRGAFHLDSGGSTTFDDSSTADSATLVADAGFDSDGAIIFMMLRVLATQSLSRMEEITLLAVDCF